MSDQPKMPITDYAVLEAKLAELHGKGEEAEALAHQLILEWEARNPGYTWPLTEAQKRGEIE